MKIVTKLHCPAYYSKDDNFRDSDLHFSRSEKNYCPKKAVLTDTERKMILINILENSPKTGDEFQKLIPPLSEEEFAQLEQCILQDKKMPQCNFGLEWHNY